MAEDRGDRTETATPRRRQKAWEEGQFARSAELSAGMLILMAVLVLKITADATIGHAAHVFRLLLSGPIYAGGESVAIKSAEEVLPDLAHIVIPAGVVMFVAALLVAGMQTGFRTTTRTLRLDPTRLMPTMGFGRLFSQQTWLGMLMHMLKVAAVVTVAYAQIKADAPMILRLARVGFPSNIAAIGNMGYALAWRIGCVLMILGLLDFIYHKWTFERDIRMTRQEIKDEFRTMEGDAQMKNRRRQMAKKMLLQRVNQDVPRADVVVTNPTELAIAIKYDPATMAAPRVVAKGAGFLAMRIRQVALQSGVPLLERKPLAQALYKGVEIGQEVPPEYYQAIAEILAYVYEMSGKGSRILQSA